MSRLVYLLQAYRLKEVPRSGWSLRGIEDAESVADHSWGTSLLCLLFAGEAGVDRAAALEIALVHDLAEAETGDLPFLAGLDSLQRPEGEKARREAAAMRALADTISAGRGGDASTLAGVSRIQARWEAYEQRADDAARFARDMNLVDMALQALIYAQQRRSDNAHDLAEFIASARARAETPLARDLLTEITAAYEQARDVQDRDGD